MSRFLLIQVWSVVAGLSSVALGEFNGYEALSDWGSLSRYKGQVVAGMASSYDRTGGNLDVNHYEWPTGLQEETVDPVTVVTVDGPGVLSRFWMPHYTADSAFKVKMYIDGSLAIDTDSDALLGGNFGYMANPLVSTMLGGQVSYEPIVFAESLKIESQNFEFPDSGWHKRHYYQYNYHKLPAGSQVSAYTGTLTTEQQTARTAVVGMINNLGENPAGNSTSSTVLSNGATNIASGESLKLSELAGSGTIRRLNLKMDGATDTELDNLRLRVRYDGKANEAIDVPVSNFFGAGHERVAYKSLPLGTDSAEGFYSYWPMPFRDGVVVELYNASASTMAIDSAAVEYESGPVAADALYLHASHNEETTTSGQDYHLMLQTEGTGHYVGNLLYVQRAGTGRGILEGDEVITVDGVLSHHGTGLEDAYNGGYYYNHVAIQTDDGDVATPESGIGPYHGLLHMDDQDFGDNFLRADQYRWLIGDYVPFEEGIEVKIENYAQNANVLFGSTVFYYLTPEPPMLLGDANLDDTVDLQDFSILKANFGTTGGWGEGNFNGDNLIDLQDFNILKAHFGEHLPEPATLGLLSLGGLMSVLSRRRRAHPYWFCPK